MNAQQRETSNTHDAKMLAGNMADWFGHSLPAVLKECNGRKPTPAQVRAARIGYFIGAGMMAEAMLDMADLWRIRAN